MELERFHRFFLFGNKMTEEVFALFTTSSVESHKVLPYNNAMVPGVEVKILNPHLEGLLKMTNTTIVSTIEPLVPIETEPCRQLTLPHSVESGV